MGYDGSLRVQVNPRQIVLPAPPRPIGRWLHGWAASRCGCARHAPGGICWLSGLMSLGQAAVLGGKLGKLAQIA